LIKENIGPGGEFSSDRVKKGNSRQVLECNEIGFIGKLFMGPLISKTVLGTFHEIGCKLEKIKRMMDEFFYFYL